MAMSECEINNNDNGYVLLLRLPLLLCCFLLLCWPFFLSSMYLGCWRAYVVPVLSSLCLHIKPVHIQHTPCLCCVSVLILFCLCGHETTTQRYYWYTNAVKELDNAMPCHRTGFHRHSIRTPATQIQQYVGMALHSVYSLFSMTM